jgi:hypothetical protein
MKRLLFALCLVALACGVPVAVAPPPEQTQEAYATEPPEIARIATDVSVAPTLVRVTITGNVNVRDLDGVATGDVYLRGQTVHAVCEGSWCYIVDTTYKFWRGCSSDAAGLGCREAE